MSPTFYLKTLTVAVAALSAAGMANAAGLDRSGQDVTAFFQDGLYAETAYTYIDADVTGKDVNGNQIDDIAEEYDFFRYGVKADINDTFSIGILYDEPFGAAADYGGSNNFVTNSSADALIQGITGNAAVNQSNIGATIAGLQGALASGNPGNLTAAQLQAAQASLIGLQAAQGVANTAGEGTNVEVRSENVTAIMGAKFGANKNFQIYGGPVAQRIQTDVKLRGTAYGPATGYTAHVSPDQEYGYIAGIAYSKPEIALKAALTYRSEIEHNTNLFENYPLATAGSGGTIPTGREGTIGITTPQSVNFDFQTGLNPTTLATAKVRWVPWGDFAIVPPLYNEVSKLNPLYRPDGLPLVSYDDDQWQVEVGVAKRLTPAFAVNGTVGWDSGAGNPTTSLGPIEGYYSVGLGAKLNVTENWAVSAGGKYLWFGDANGQIPSRDVVSDFQDNEGYILGVKLSYQAKQGF